jgi:hypothetical protein
MLRRDMIRKPLILGMVIAVIVVGCGNGPVTPAPASSSADLRPTATVSPTTSASSTAAPTATPAPIATPAPTATPVPAATPVPTATPAPTPTPWKTRKSKRFHYVIKYPPTWVATPGSAKFADTYDGYDYPYVYISRDTVPGSVSISRTVTSDIAYYKSHYKAKVISNKAIKLKGWSGRIVTYKGKDGRLNVIIQKIILAKGSVGYFLTMIGEASTADADKAVFKKMYRTFRPT